MPEIGGALKQQWYIEKADEDIDLRKAHGI